MAAVAAALLDGTYVPPVAPSVVAVEATPDTDDPELLAVVTDKGVLMLSALFLSNSTDKILVLSSMEIPDSKVSICSHLRPLTFSKQDFHALH